MLHIIARLKAILFVVIFALLHTLVLRAQSAEPVKMVVPVTIDAQVGSITVGGTVYPGANPGMQMLVLSRQPKTSSLGSPTLIGNQTFTDAASADQFLQSVLGNTPDAILILNGVGNYGFGPAALSDTLAKFGATGDEKSAIAAVPFVLIGNGGLNASSAHERLSSNLNMSGSFATDSNGNYIFVQTDYIKYDIGLDGTIKIGTTTYAAGNSCTGSNAFNLVVVSRESPETLVTYKVYCTAESDSEINEMTNEIATFTQDEAYLLFIGSTGHPIPANWNFDTDGDPRTSPLGAQIALLGGYWETMAYLTPNDTYSLVGAPPPAAGTPNARNRAKESSSVYLLPNPTKVQYASGELHGVLARGLRGNWYSPLNSDPTGLANLGLYEILAQAPVHFPHTATVDELGAFQYISQQFCGDRCNVRNQYPDLNIDFSAYVSRLQAMNDPIGNPCGQSNSGTPFCIVRQQLLTEFDYVANIHEFNQNVAGLWSSSQGTSIATLLSTYEKLQNDLNPPPQASAPSLVSPIVNFFLGLLSFIPDVGSIFGIADTAFNLGESLTSDPQGNPAISLITQVANLESQAATLFTQQATTTGTQFSMIYQDWGKISALGTELANATPGSAWYWAPTTTGQILQAMAPAVESAYYQSFLSSLYAVGAYYPEVWGGWPSFGQKPLWGQPGSYGVNSSYTNNVVEPFMPVAYFPYTFPSDPDTSNSFRSLGSPTSTLLSANSWLGISLLTTPNDGGETGFYQPPPIEVLQHLFSPVSQSGLGVYRPAFFEGWPFPHIVCDASDPNGEGDPGQGCPWSSAAPAPESVSQRLTKVSVTLRKHKPAASELLKVRVLIANSGPSEVRSVRINNISLRTLAGSGQATLVSPNLPLQTELLAPGATVALTLTVNVPATIKKISFTENGEIDSGKSTTERFSHQQVIFP